MKVIEMNESVLFEAGKDKSLKRFEIYVGKTRKGKIFREGSSNEFNGKMTADEVQAAERHLARRFVVEEFKDNGNTVTIKLKKINVNELQKSIAKELKNKIDGEGLIRDVLEDLPLLGLKDLHERVVKKKGKVKSQEGCYNLQIGGKRGRPMELFIRD